MANSYRTSSPTDTGSVNYHAQEYALAKGLGRLGEDLLVAKLVTNYTEQARDQGSKFGMNVRVPKRGAAAVADKTPGTAVTPVAVTSTKADIAVDKHKTWDILIEDYGALFTQKGLLSGYLEDGASEIAEAIEADLMALYASAGQTLGSYGSGIDDALLREMRRASRVAKWRMSQPSYAVWGPYQEEDILAIDKLVKVNEAGTDKALREAWLGRIYGFDQMTSNQVVSVAGSPAQENGMAFQREAIGLAMVDMDLQDALPGGIAAPGVEMSTMNLTDDDGASIYSMRTIIGYSQTERGTMLTVDSMYGVGVVRSELLFALRS